MFAICIVCLQAYRIAVVVGAVVNNDPSIPRGLEFAPYLKQVLPLAAL